MWTRRSIIRLKSSLGNGLNDVITPNAKDVLRNKLEQKLIDIKKSALGRRIEIAKEYYKLEMAPPKYSELRHLRDDLVAIVKFFIHGNFKRVTVRDAWLFLLVCAEVGLWFFMGEVIGKRHLVGYKV